MSKTLVGIGTFGNLGFTKLAVESIQKTIKKHDYEILIVVGKPGDTETLNWARNSNFNTIVHQRNMGFGYTINDIYDHAWKSPGGFDYVLIMGNDVVAYPYAVDSMIEVADTTEYEWICSREVTVQNLVTAFPQTKGYFDKPNYKYRFGSGPCWEYFKNYSEKIVVGKAGMLETHNLGLYKKSFFDKVGYIDVNFYPAYFSDNDMCRRAILSKVTSCSVDNARYFHFWSRTIHQGSGGSTGKYFSANSSYYNLKWGGGFMQETYQLPFNGEDYQLPNGTMVSSLININTRDREDPMINNWR